MKQQVPGVNKASPLPQGVVNSRVLPSISIVAIVILVLLVVFEVHYVSEAASGWLTQFLIETSVVSLCMLLGSIYWGHLQTCLQWLFVPEAKPKKVAEDDSGIDLDQIRRSKGTRMPSSLSGWSQAISTAAKSKDCMAAERLLEELLESDLAPDAACFNSVIHAYAVRGEVQHAADWMTRMQHEAVSPNAITYNILMDACAKAEDPEGAELWLRQMKESSVAPNDVSYATVIHAQAKTGDLGRAEQWLRTRMASLDLGRVAGVVRHHPWELATTSWACLH